MLMLTWMLLPGIMHAHADGHVGPMRCVWQTIMSPTHLPYTDPHSDAAGGSAGLPVHTCTHVHTCTRVCMHTCVQVWRSEDSGGVSCRLARLWGYRLSYVTRLG